MRYVDPRRVEDFLPGPWVGRARAAKSEILAEDDKDRINSVLRRLDVVWQDIKEPLKRVMENKCWYCETKQLRSDNAVDHFRPKSMYWWLAFDYSNYRFTCTYCNSRRKDKEFGTSGGKQDDFPLVNAKKRASRPGDDINAEIPLLLDPCEFDDPDVLWFDEIGLPEVNPLCETDENVVRVQISTRLYHLDHSYLVTARREKYLEITQMCSEGDAEYRRYEELGDRDALVHWSALVVRVYRAIERSAEHSAAAMCAVRGLRTKSVTAKKALDRL